MENEKTKSGGVGRAILRALSQCFSKKRESSNPNAISLVAIQEQNTHGSTEPEVLPDWSALNDSLLFSIARLLDTMEDYTAFRLVCSMWRSAAAPTPDVLASQHPLLCITLDSNCYGLSDIVTHRTNCCEFYDIVTHRIYKIELCALIIGYGYGFLVIVTLTEIHRVEMKLTNIFTITEICLPSEAGVGICVIFSKNPSCHDCLVVCFSRGSSEFQYCRVGDSRWVYEKCDKKRLDDMIFFEGRLYATSDEGDLFLVELFPYLKTTIMGRKDTLIKKRKLVSYFKLVESSGELLLVYIGNFYKSCQSYHDRCNVYIWDFKRRIWVEKSSLGGRALFIGHYLNPTTCSGGSIVPPPGSKIKENCVYVTDVGKTSWRVYSLEDKSVESCSMVELFCKPMNDWDVLSIWVLPSSC